MAKNVEGWELEQDAYLNRASRSGADLYVDGDWFEAYLTQGSGYMRQDITERIHLDVIVEMLRHAGYKVSKKATGG